MKRIHRLISILILIMLVYFINPDFALAAVNLPWSTTYNCAEWDQSKGTPSCDGISPGGGWTTLNGNKEQITTDANNPGGGGGKGERHWVGPDVDGAHQNSGGLVVTFTSGVTEYWVRWYMRFESGFTWNNPYINGYKVIYLNTAAGLKNYILIGYGTNGSFCYRNQYPSNPAHSKNYCPSPSWGFSNIYGGNVSDGSWHCYEMHIKSESGYGIEDGVVEVWVDGIRRLYSTAVDHGLIGAGLTQTGFLIGSNISGFLSTSVDMYVDYDDIAVSNTGYIGPIPSSPTAPVAEFSAIIDGNLASFSDTSTYSPTSWSWNFGDGGTSTSRNPTHQYQSAGNYTVTLTTTNAYGTNSVTKTVNAPATPTGVNVQILP
jgi:hypothetical protein